MLLVNDKTMDSNEEQRRAQWNEAIARMVAQIDDFKDRMDSESQLLCTKLSAEIALLQSDLELEAFGAGSDAYARRVAKLIEQLRAQGEAAYELMQATLPPDVDSTSVEIRQLEALATSMTGDAKATLITRIEELRAARATAQPPRQTERLEEQSSEKQYSPHG